jgi:hypothetical protein
LLERESLYYQIIHKIKLKELLDDNENWWITLIKWKITYQIIICTFFFKKKKKKEEAKCYPPQNILDQKRENIYNGGN